MKFSKLDPLISLGGGEIMSEFHKMDRNQFIDFLTDLNKEFNFNFDQNLISCLWLKKLPSADIVNKNKPKDSGGHTSHIAVTGFSMDMFPFNGEDWYKINVDVIKEKIIYKNQSRYISKSTASIREATDRIGKHQIYISNRKFDGKEFYSLRDQLFKDDYLLILKYRYEDNYLVIGFDKTFSDLKYFQKNLIYLKSEMYYKFSTKAILSDIKKMIKSNSHGVKEIELLDYIIKKYRSGTKEELDEIIKTTLNSLVNQKKIQEITNESGSFYIIFDSNLLEYSSEIIEFNTDSKLLSEEELLQYKGRKIDKLVEKNRSKLNRYPTNPSLKMTALIRARYSCEYGNIIGENHATFQSKNYPGEYMEGHHLIRMCDQENELFYDEGKYVSLDQIENIVSLCPICHSKIHFGKDGDVKKMLESLYLSRKDGLKEADLNISLTDLIELYLGI